MVSLIQRAQIQMLTAYVFEVIFSTLCVIAAIHKHPDNRDYQGVLYNSIRKHEFCIYRTMEIFLDAATFFAFSIGVAGLTGIWESGFESYKKNLTMSVAVFSILPLLVVLPLSYDRLRRKRLRVGFVILAMLMATVLVAGDLLIYNPSAKANYWEQACGDTYALVVIIWRVCIVFICLLAIQVIIGPVCYCFVLLFQRRVWENHSTFLERFKQVQHDRRKTRHMRWHRRKHPWIRYIYGFFVFDDQPFTWRLSIVSLLMTWVMMGLILWTRFSMQNAAGEHYEENKMTFGQVLSGLMWLPVVVDYVYMFVCKNPYYCATTLPWMH